LFYPLTEFRMIVICDYQDLNPDEFKKMLDLYKFELFNLKE